MSDENQTNAANNSAGADLEANANGASTLAENPAGADSAGQSGAANAGANAADGTEPAGEPAAAADAMLHEKVQALQPATVTIRNNAPQDPNSPVIEVSIHDSEAFDLRPQEAREVLINGDTATVISLSPKAQ